MAERNICSVDLLQTMSENTNVIVDENGTLNKLNIYNEFNTVNTKIDNNYDVLNTSMLQLSNPNLLINSDFRNPINQRGETSYSGNASSSVYTIDRWMIMSSDTTLEVLDGSIKLTNGSSDGYLQQSFEDTLGAGTFTFTINVKEVSGDVYLYDSRMKLSNGVNIYTGEFTDIDNIHLHMLTNSTIELEYIKLEQGSIATPFVPEHIATLDNNCKRFRQHINFNNSPLIIPQTKAENGVYYYAGFTFLTSMRTNPTMTSWAIKKDDGTTDLEVTGYRTSNDGLSFIWSHDNCKYIEVYYANFDAEIY